MNSPTIAILGAGNMGASLLGGLINNQYPADQLWVTDTDTTKLELLKKQFHVQTSTNNQTATQSADVIILAVKPQIVSQVIADIAPIVKKHNPLILSIAAGVRISSIQQGLGEATPIVRVMPNTPALIGCGASVLYANHHVTATQHSMAESILRAVGITVWIDDENQMDIVTALSGSGPAYFFLIIEALQKAAQQLGLPEETAKILTLQTAYGATRMAMESEHDVVKLRQQVTSPGGTTEQAIRVFEEENIHALCLKVLSAAQHRSKELAEMFEKTMEK